MPQKKKFANKQPVYRVSKNPSVDPSSHNVLFRARGFTEKNCRNTEPKQKSGLTNL